MYLDNDLIFLNKQFDKRDEALEFLSKKLLDNGCVNSGYYDAVVEREKNFPTGLQGHEFGFAIPHTEADFVKTSQIAVLTLSKPIIFQNMDGSGDVPVNLIIMLALKPGNEQLEFLQKIMGLFYDEHAISEIIHSVDIEEVKNKFKEFKII
ncbi:PTS sugar transporter subunit IIA [Aerococcus tenax]|uniref:PTS sugar transporter subunit IIA n=1 Tax=Aerococcus tenax TaxID=3078812 RepID=UPI0018A7151E|nr:PTS sugar transporter subunit IIA [Aerococcus tenax]